MPKLTPEESKAIGGAAAEAEKQAKAKAAKEAIDKLGKSADDVKFKKGALPKGIRVSGKKEVSVGPKPQLTKKEKPKRLPRVKRGASGRAEKIVPVDITKPKEKPVSPVTPRPTKRKKTRTGKKIDTATGRIAVPLVKRGEGGRAVGTTPAEREEVFKTELPTAGPEVMQPAVQGQTTLPVGVLQRGGQRKLRGFGVPHVRVKAAVDAALHHLNGMTQTQGTPEFEDHNQAFNAIHENIQNMDRHGLGITIGQLKHQTLSGGSKSPHILRQIHSLIQDRLEEGRMAEEENKARAQAGRERKAGNP